LELIFLELIFSCGNQNNHAHGAWSQKTRSVSVAKKTDPTAYDDVRYDCRTESPNSHGHVSTLLNAAHGYSRCRNFGGSVFAMCCGWTIHHIA